MSRVEGRLRELGIALPKVAAPAGAYVPTVISGALLYVSGQLPYENGQLHYVGKIGHPLSVEDGYAAARLCGLNILAQVQAALGDLDQVRRCVKLGGFVNATPDFADHPKVINGASDLMLQVFGETGRHARFAVGAASLPLNVAVEVEALFEIA